MKSLRVVQIVPRRGKSPEGVGDYARLMAEQMLVDHDIRTTFLSGTPLPVSDRVGDAWNTAIVKKRSATELVNELDGLMPFDAILVHFSGYGYHNRGAPTWLVSGLERWRSAFPGVPIVTMFHELNAVTGRFWNSSFWFSPLQKYLCRKLAVISDKSLATTKSYADQLSEWSPHVDVSVVPVFSTVGTASDVMGFSERKHILVTFGTAKLARRIFIDGMQKLERLVEEHRVSEIWDIGPRHVTLPREVAGVGITQFGRCETDFIVSLLGKAAFGLVDYPAGVIEKSTVCAAFAANGVIPILFCEDECLEAAGYVVLGTNPRCATMDRAQLSDIQLRNKATYFEKHSLKIATQTVARALSRQ